VIERSLLSVLPANSLVLCPGVWRAIEIYEGASIIDEIGIVCGLSCPLAEAGFEMIYLSTYHTDLILVKEEKVKEAFECLQKTMLLLTKRLAKDKQKHTHKQENRKHSHDHNHIHIYGTNGQQTTNSHDDNLNLNPNPQPSSKPLLIVKKQTNKPVTIHHSSSPNGMIHEEDTFLPLSVSPSLSTSPPLFPSPSSLPPAGTEPAKIHISALQNKLIIAHFPKSQLPQCAFAILKIVLDQRRTNFFSYTCAGNDVSVIVDQENVSAFPEGVLSVNGSTWQALRVALGHGGLESVGLVAPLSRQLAQAKISIYYLSTFNTDLTLVLDKESQRALDVLANNPEVLVDRSL